HQTFTELSVEGAEPAEVVRQAARMAGLPVVLENLAHQVLAYDAAGHDPGDLLAGWEARSRGVEQAGRTGYDPRTGWLAPRAGAEAAVDSLAAALRRLTAQDEVLVAAGSEVADVRDVRRSFLEASHVADAAGRLPGRTLHRLEDVRLRGLLHLLRDDTRL